MAPTRVDLVQMSQRRSQTPRQVLLVLNKSDDRVYALDGRCFHAGAPLELSDIEDIGGRSCLRCPMHSYRIDIKTGEHILAGGNDKKHARKTIKSRGVCQRTHSVTVDSQGNIYVELDEPKRDMPKDKEGQPTTQKNASANDGQKLTQKFDAIETFEIASDRYATMRDEDPPKTITFTF
mmetsp:Transcript_19276/g.27129  ORF Transcript_19276/g.27129 Transcript_19276/m.27129 type:complete len:179 (+) Transcript_19276:141-677(+)